MPSTTYSDTMLLYRLNSPPFPVRAPVAGDQVFNTRVCAGPSYCQPGLEAFPQQTMVWQVNALWVSSRWPSWEIKYSSGGWGPCFRHLSSLLHVSSDSSAQLSPLQSLVWSVFILKSKRVKLLGQWKWILLSFFFWVIIFCRSGR